MKALTVQNPWAWAIIHGGKRVENRTIMWKYRGPVAIHAGSRWSDRGGRSELVWEALREQYGWTHGPTTARDDPRPRFDALRPCGAFLGVVDLVDVHRAAPGCCDSPWAEDQYVEATGGVRRSLTHLTLENPRPLPEPIPVSGALGLWTPQPHDLSALEAAL